MGDIDLEKLRSVRQGGRTAGKVRVRDVDGRKRSFEIDHPDGRKAAVVRPDTVRATVSMSNPTVAYSGTGRPQPIKARASVKEAR